MIVMTEENVKKGFGQENVAPAPQAQAQPQAAPAPNAPVAQANGQTGNVSDYIESIRSSLQKAVDALNQVASSLNSANETNAGLTDAMQKIAKDIADIKAGQKVVKTVGNTESVNEAQERERQDAPKEPHVDPGAGETTEHKEVEPTEAELKEKVPGKQTLGQKEEVEKTKKIVKTVETPTPTLANEKIDTDIHKSAIKDVLGGKLKNVNSVIEYVRNNRSNS